MELLVPLLIIGAVIFFIVKVFRRGKKKAPDTYVVVTEHETRQRVYKVPGGEKRK